MTALTRPAPSTPQPIEFGALSIQRQLIRESPQ
jgi:hypothetical protein